MRSTPPVAARDADIAALSTEVDRLRAEVARQQAVAERRADGPESWDAPTAPRARRAIRASGLFDEEWYLRQVTIDGTLPVPGDDVIGHYLRHGAAAGLSPHPGFLVAWYVEQVREHPGYRSVPRIARRAFVHYLTVGAHRGLSPHPALDATEYLSRHPDAAEHPGGPLGHLLAGRDRTAVSTKITTMASAPSTSTRTSAEFEADATRVADNLLHSGRHWRRHLQRDSPDFDRVAEGALKESVLSGQGPEPRPLVSVVLPTKDRAELVGDTIASVLAQTWTDWELLVVNDGSTDDTAAVLAAIDDPRVVVLRHESARGVAGARNTALANATGRYVAYIDSDNTWMPDFLELMVRFMDRENHRVAYAVSALVEHEGEGRVLYRGMPFSREALWERNYIDCIVLVHERALLEEVGTFDETLRRTVDWDLFIRLSRVADFAYLPVIATEYDVWDTRTDRVTTEESIGWRYAVRQRTLVDWSDLQAGISARDPHLVSVVVVARDRAADVIDTVHRCLARATSPTELVVVDASLSETEGARVQLELLHTPAVTVHRVGQPLPLEVARNVGAARTRGRHLVFLAAGAWTERGWEQPLVGALADHAAVQPVVLDRGGTIWSAGVFVRDDGRGIHLFRGLPGRSPEVRGLRECDGVVAACMAIEAETFVRLEGFDPLVMNAWTGCELSVRAARLTGLPVACAGDSEIALARDPYEGRSDSVHLMARANDALQRRVWAGRVSSLPDRLAQAGLRVVGHERSAASGPDPDGHPLLVHDRPDRPLRWSLKIGPRDVPSREPWGDWHFAEALADSLERWGHTVTIDCADEWYRPSSRLDDVSLVLRGVRAYDPHPDHVSLLWAISHPDAIPTPELRTHDAVFGASQRWCDQVRRRLDVPVTTLLQCTDQRRFHPVPVDQAHRHEVLFVGNARGIRPTVAAALQAGVVPDVYGARWNGLLPPGAWKGRYIPNDLLTSHYVSSGVVLNDHHEDMRIEGMVSNRLFDLAACGARVVSDAMPEIDDVFDGVVLTWEEPRQIPDLVRQHLDEDPERRERRLALAERVRAEHTFDARARTLSETVDRLLAQRGRGRPGAAASRGA